MSYNSVFKELKLLDSEINKLQNDTYYISKLQNEQNQQNQRTYVISNNKETDNVRDSNTATERNNVAKNNVRDSDTEERNNISNNKVTNNVRDELAGQIIQLRDDKRDLIKKLFRLIYISEHRINYFQTIRNKTDEKQYRDFINSMIDRIDELNAM